MPGLELRYNNPGWSYAATASVLCLVSTGQRGCAGRENGLLGLCPGLNAVGDASTTGEQTKAIQSHLVYICTGFMIAMIEVRNTHSYTFGNY